MRALLQISPFCAPFISHCRAFHQTLLAIFGRHFIFNARLPSKHFGLFCAPFIPQRAPLLLFSLLGLGQNKSTPIQIVTKATTLPLGPSPLLIYGPTFPAKAECKSPDAQSPRPPHPFSSGPWPNTFVIRFAWCPLPFRRPLPAVFAFKFVAA